MSLLNRFLGHLRMALVAVLVVLGALAVPGIAQATEVDLETSETTAPTLPVESPETTVPVEPESTQSPAEKPTTTPPPATNSPTKSPAILSPSNRAPAGPAPVRPVPAQPAPINPDNSSGQGESIVAPEDVPLLETESAEAAITAPTTSAIPSPSSTTAAPTSVPSTVQTEQPDTVMASSLFPGGPTASQLLMVGLLSLLGVLYLRFMRRDARRMTPLAVQPVSKNEKSQFREHK